MNKNNNLKRKGRSAELLKDRDICLLYRHYYYTKICGISYLDSIEALGREFFITSRNVLHRMSERSEYLRDIKINQKPNVLNLHVMYPWMVW